jgi:hypothetical protein
MEDAAIDIMIPVLESATVLAAHYARSCGRDVILAEDMRLGLMYAARNVTGKQIGPIYPEVWDESDEEEEEESGSDSDEEDPEWVRYEGSDDMANKMNECADTWDAWEPESPAERALKSAVDKQREN